MRSVSGATPQEGPKLSLKHPQCAHRTPLTHSLGFEIDPEWTSWQLAGSTLGTMSVEKGLQPGVWVCPGVWIPNQGYTQVFEYARAFVSPNGVTYRRLDPQPRLHTGVWSPNRSYTRVSGVPNRGYTRVFGVPNGRSCKLPSGTF